MRNLQMQIKRLLLLSSFTVLLLPQPAEAEGEREKGKLRIHSDRILKDDEEEQSQNITTLDLLFPDLFTAETVEKVATEQARQEAEVANLRDFLFQGEIEVEPMREQVRSDLFPEEYEAPFSSRRTEEPEEEEAALSSILFYGSIVTVVGLIGTGVFFLLRRF